MSTKTTTDDRPILERAWAAVPGLPEAEEALRRLRAHRPKPKPPVPNVLETAADAIAAGEPIPEDLGQRLLEQRRAGEEQAAEGDAFRGLQDLLRGRAASARAQGTDAALAVVATELEAVMVETREVARVLGSARTAEAAIDAGPEATEAWQELRRLVARYDDVRQAQRQLVAADFGGGGPQTGDTLHRAGWLANQYEIDPDLRRRMREAAARREDRPVPQAVTGFKSLGLDPEWPAPDEDQVLDSWWPTKDRPAYLLWLATGPAKPWVPSVRQLKAKMEEVARVVSTGLPPGTPEAAPPAADDQAAFKRELRSRERARWEGEDMAEANRRAGGVR